MPGGRPGDIRARIAGAWGLRTLARAVQRRPLLLVLFLSTGLPAGAAGGDGRFAVTDLLRRAEATPPAPVSDHAKTAVDVAPVETAEPPPAASGKSEANDVEVVGDRSSTLFQLTLTRGVTAEVYTLANPYRVIIDLPDLEFRLPEDAGRKGRGLVTAFRYGQFADGKARIVMDTEGPVQIGKAAMSLGRNGTGVVLVVELKPTDAGAFGDGTGAERSAAKAAEARAARPDDEVQKPAGRQRPVIVIDAGHGGVDPGAVGADNALEKDIVLSVARKVRARLAAKNAYDLVMTRSTDVFVSLGERLAISRRHASDLFISIHADSIEESAFTQSIKGATVYTLSERASDAQARAMAEKENASDMIAGLDVVETEDDDQVRSILIDLLKRETSNFSAEFSRMLVRKLKSNISLSRVPQRSASFKVLKQTHAPSVLVELGYVSNPEQARQMRSPAWQAKVAASIAAAVDAYFEKRVGGSP